MTESEFRKWNESQAWPFIFCDESENELIPAEIREMADEDGVWAIKVIFKNADMAGKLST